MRRCRQRSRSLVAAVRARHRSRTASSAGLGGTTSVSRPARCNSASLRASRRLVLMRSPGCAGNQGGRNDLTAHPATAELAWQDVAARAGFVATLHRAGGGPFQRLFENGALPPAPAGLPR